MKKIIINSIYILAVFLVALFITSTALVRRISTYKSIQKPLFITIDKQEIILTNAAPGRIEKIFVQEGQYVSTGDLIASMTDETVNARIKALESTASDNTSARTEAIVLRSQLSSYDIRAPRDGIIYKINLAAGSYVGSIMPLITLYGEGDTNLYMTVSEEQYQELKKEKKLYSYSPRLEQTFETTIAGVSRASFDDNSKTRSYELRLSFTNPDDEKAFIEGETLELSIRKDDNIALKPSETLAQVVNAVMGIK